MDRGAWWATVQRVSKSHTTERLWTHNFFYRNKAMLVTVFGNHFSLFSESLFSWVPRRLSTTTSVGYRAQRPLESWQLLVPGKRSLGAWMCRAVPALSLPNGENWGEGAGLTQREEQRLSEEGLKGVELKLYSKEVKVFYTGRGFYGNLSLFEIWAITERSLETLYIYIFGAFYFAKLIVSRNASW